MSHRKPTEPDEPTQETKPRPRKKGKKMPEAFDIDEEVGNGCNGLDRRFVG